MREILDYFVKLVNDPTFNKGDAGAGGIMLASVVNALPTVSCALTIIWVGLRIYVSIRDDFFKKENKSGD